MTLSNVRIENFRLLRDVVLEFHPGVNFFVGQNAQGKTSLLEAIHYLSVGRSFRTNKDRECQSLDGDHQQVTAITGLLSTNDKVRLAFQTGKKKVWYNDNLLPVLTDLWGILMTVIFQPSDLQILQGSPSKRRELIDRIAGQLDRNHLRETQAYQKALQSRNQLLKSRQSNPKVFHAFEKQIAIHGSRIMETRLSIIRQLSEIVRPCLEALSDTAQKKYDSVLLQYESQILKGEEKVDLIELQDRLEKALEKQRPKELERRQTLVGPQRDDMSLIVDGKDAKTYASQGEIRSAVLALRLAELRLLDQSRPGTPILLLDDILGELDQKRSARFLELVKDCKVQTFITSTDAQFVESNLSIDQRFEVLNGQIE